MNKEVREILDDLYWHAHATGNQKNMPDDEKSINLALSRLGEIIRGKKESVPKLEDKSTFGDTFEFWNISGRNQAISEIAEMFDPQK